MNDRSQRRKAMAVAAALTLFVCVIGLIDFASELGTDYGGYFSHGWFITHGLVPYRDFWTHKTPLLPLILSAWIGMTGTGFIAAAMFPLLLTCLASFVVYAFGRTLGLSTRVSAGSAVVFAFFAAGHGIDPSRNGVIIIAATTFEMLALVMVFRSVRAERRVGLVCAGAFIALAVATRQTSAVVWLPVAGAIVAMRGRSGPGRAAGDVAFTVAGFVLACVALAASLAPRVPLTDVWDQIYRFNLIYAAGHRIKVTWWLSGWLQFVLAKGLLLLIAGVAAFGVLAATRRRIGVRGESAVVLLLMVVAHLAAIYTSRKITGMYLLQLLPELSILTAVATASAIAAARVARSRARLGAIAAVVTVLVVLPLRVEFQHWRDVLTRASAGGFLAQPSSLPMQRLARRIQALVPEDGRIWVFSASADALYPYSGRLPSMPITSTAPLVYEQTPDDFARWKRDFETGRPALVVSFYGDAYVQSATRNPGASNGQTDATILKIRTLLASRMRRVDDGRTLPELYAW